MHALAALAVLLLSQTGADGEILEKREVAPPQPATYAAYAQRQRERYESEAAGAKASGMEMRSKLHLRTEEEWKRDQSTPADTIAERIVYRSDGLRVVAYVWRPRKAASEKLPLIVFCRGGNRENSAVTPWGNAHRYAQYGYVVIASQYRGVDGGEGREEFGGADVRDVLNLLPAARNLGYWDGKDAFLHGHSRGGMQAYLALKAGMPVRAAAIGAGLADLSQWLAERPNLEQLYKDLIPRYDEDKAKALEARSAVRWPEKINAPVLILHGEFDWRVGISQAANMARKLEQAGKKVRFVTFPEDDHTFSHHADEARTQIVAWFREHASAR